MYGRVDALKAPTAGQSSRPPTPTSNGRPGVGSRPPTPSGEAAEPYVFSTSLRRVTNPDGEGGGPFRALVSPPKHHHHHHAHHHHHHPNHQHSAGSARYFDHQAYPNSHQPGRYVPRQHDVGGGGGAFSHTAKSSTPSAHYATRPVEYAVQTLATHPTLGLHSADVAAVRALHGPNEFEVDAKEPRWRKFVGQFYESPLNLLLLASAAVSGVVGNMDDAISITAAIVIVVTVGFVQEQRSEKSLEALNKLVPHYAHLIRDGHGQTLLANVLVPGDLVTFSTGDRIPADVRLLSAHALEIDESAMTGETHPARKTTEPIAEVPGGDGVPALADRTNVALMGTLVRSGKGSGIVVATGLQTEFGSIFSMMQDVEERKTPLQLSMDELAKRLSVISFAVIGVICLIGVWQKRGWLEMFTIGVSLAVAAIPEGLPIVVTVTLALGVLRMAKRKAIVKKLPSVETLGSVSVICSDKTGTLTANRMTVKKVFSLDDGTVDIYPPSPSNPTELSEALRQTMTISNVCSNAYRNRDGVVVGQSTDAALLDALRLVGLDDCRTRFTRRLETPFSSDLKYASVTGHFHEPAAPAAPELVYVTGAAEVVLARCKTYLRRDGAVSPLDQPTQAKVAAHQVELARTGLRVLGMASGPTEDSLTFAGLQAMMDPPRVGVAEAVSKLQRGGVQVVMITGDAEHTALSIAAELGIRMQPGTQGCLTGKEIDLLSQRQLVDRIPGISVFARVTPRHKMALIEAYQARGAIVAMTGDGVNDAPALRMADIGISMGKGATDVAKEAADVILVDDNFATILPAVEEGKSIFYNIQNFLAFQLSTAVAALSLITLSTALHLQSSPLNAMQILFINILMDGPPSQSLGVDPVDREVMRRPPRDKQAPVLTQRLLYRVAFSASMIVLGTLFVYLHELSDGRFRTRDQTMTFTSFVFLDLVSALQNRGLTVPLLPAVLGAGRLIAPRPYNKVLLATVSVSFVTQLGIIYLAPLQGVFQTEALSSRDLGVLLILAATSFALHEGRRRFERNLDKRRRTWEEAVA